MTDKVQKIREEVERRIIFQKECIKNSYRLTGKPEEEIILEYKQLLSFIDSLPEEPVSVWHDASKKSDNPEDVVIINPSDNTGEVLTKCTGVNQGHIWAYTSELLNLDNSCNIGKNLQEELISEELEEAVDGYTRKVLERTNCLIGNQPVGEEISKAVKFGAKWQKKADHQ